MQFCHVRLNFHLAKCCPSTNDFRNYFSLATNVNVWAIRSVPFVRPLTHPSFSSFIRRSFISPHETNVPSLSVFLWSNHPIISVTWSLTGPSSVFDINEGQQRTPIKQSEVKSASIPLHRSFVLSSNVKDGDIQRHPLPIIKCQSTSESTNSNFTKFLFSRGLRLIRM